MRKYELMYIIRPDLEEAQVEAAIEKVKDVIGKNGGAITSHDVKGKRRLAYEINKFRDGIYVLVNFEAPAGVVEELDRIIKINDEIIRHLVVQDVA